MPSETRGCTDFARLQPHRREFLRIGGLGLTGLSLARLLQIEARAESRSRRSSARSVILLFQFGGPSHLDTFDPKPEAPSGIRGEFAAIPTTVPSVRVTE